MYSFFRSKAINTQAMRIIYLSSPTTQKKFDCNYTTRAPVTCTVTYIITTEEQVFISPL